ncbi:MAG: hypothetical protein ACI841_001055 [Planctomycetota bacterium]|jgi:hypothetical protein
MWSQVSISAHALRRNGSVLTGGVRSKASAEEPY